MSSLSTTAAPLVARPFVATSLVAASLCVGMFAFTAPVHAAPPIHWDAPVKWTPWAQAMTKAKAENKPVCLVVYADWCPKCRKIAPFFNKPELLAATDKAVLVLQNEDEKPEWLASEFGSSGNYVPRIFCLDKGGNIDHTINSGNERFPFFYRPNDQGITKLLSSIDKAAQKVGGPVQVAAPQAAAPPVAAPPVAVGAGQPAPAAPPAEGPSDLPIMIGLALAAIGAVWFVGRKG